MNKRILLFLTLAVLACVSVAAAQGVPQLINYQGKLYQPSGAPVPDGSYKVAFSIYDVPTGGTALWTETYDGLTVKGSVFHVLLGSVNPIGATIFSGPDRYLGVKVGADPELTPRQKIASVPYAMVAQSVPDGVITGANLAASSLMLGHSQVTQAQYFSTETDLTNLTVTVNVPPGGHSVKITGYGIFDSAGLGNKTTLFICEGSTYLEEADIYNSTAVAGGSGQSLMCEAVVTPSPGAHTYRLRASASIGSALVADPNRPAFILVELL